MSARTKFVHSVWKSFLLKGGHETTCLPTLTILEIKKDFIQASLIVEESHLNRLGGLHGGLISTLVDSTGSLVVSTRGFYFTGVSTDINVTFVRGAKVKEKVLIESSLINLGRNLAFTRVEIWNEERKKLLAFGSHTKFIAGSRGGEGNVEFDD